MKSDGNWLQLYEVLQQIPWLVRRIAQLDPQSEEARQETETAAYLIAKSATVSAPANAYDELSAATVTRIQS